MTWPRAGKKGFRTSFAGRMRMSFAQIDRRNPEANDD
jgi:hypothetical protein